MRPFLNKELHRHLEQPHNRGEFRSYVDNVAIKYQFKGMHHRWGFCGSTKHQTGFALVLSKALETMRFVLGPISEGEKRFISLFFKRFKLGKGL